MSASQHAEPSGVHTRTILALQDEIVFQKVMLESIQGAGVDNEKETTEEILREIRKLQTKLKDLKDQDKSKQTLQGSSVDALGSFDDGGSSSRSGLHLSQQRGNVNHKASSSSKNNLRGTELKSLVAEQLASPTKMSLPERKRSFSSHHGRLSIPAISNKSRRTTPSPFISRPNTPLSSSGDDFDPAEFVNATRHAELKAEQERADEEFARLLQYGSPSPMLLPSQPPQNRAATVQGTLSWSQPNPVAGSSSRNNNRATLSQPNYYQAGSYRGRKEDSDSDLEISSFLDYVSDHRNQNHVKLEDNTVTKPEHRDSALHQEALYGRGPPQGWVNSASSSTSYGGQQVKIETNNSWPALDNSSSSVISGSNFQNSGNRGSYPARMTPLSQMSMPGAFPGSDYGASGLGYTLGSSPSVGIVIDSSSDEMDEIRHRARAMQDDPYRNIYDQRYSDIVNDPRKTDEEIKTLLANIRPDEDLPKEDREGTPAGLKYELYEHQKLALTWLKSMEEGPNKGSILADDMGLGKTISALALMLTRPSSNPPKKTTLIVGPVALVRQWEREIHTKINASHRMSTFMLHGKSTAKNTIGWNNIQVYDVVLTTYGTLAAEFKRLDKYLAQKRSRNELLDNNDMARQFPCLSPKSHFHRIILDEAQCIKNKGTISAKACYGLQADYRLVLTGTPMMNNIGELYSLILFLGIRPYNEWGRFKASFASLLKPSRRGADPKHAMKRLQILLKAILLRRVKTSLIDGKPIINLPPKTEEIQHVVFDDEEQAFYGALESKTQLQFNKYLKKGTVGKNYSNILALLLRLRQACCHPHLIQDFEQAPNELGMDELVELAKSLDEDVVRRILAADDSFDCPICYDGVQNPAILIPCGHDCCSECLTKLLDMTAQNNIAHGMDAGNSSKCPTCRGEVSRAKAIDYSTFKKVFKETPEDEISTASEHSVSDSDSDSDLSSDSDDDNDDAGSDGDLRDFVVPDDVESNDEEEPPTEAEDELAKSENEASARIKKSLQKKPMQDLWSDSDDEFLGTTRAMNPLSDNEEYENRKERLDEETGEDDEHSKENKSRRKVIMATKIKKVKRVKKPTKSKKTDKKGKGKAVKKKKEHVSIAMLKTQANKSAKGRHRYMKYLRKNWQPSAKVTKCVELLEQFQKEGEKTIIFSQFVSLLDLLQVPIEDKGWGFERYDGSMNAEARNDAIIRFTEKSKSKIMLISLKAGNAGLNLVAASRVIILDPFWNPYIEMQAVDRAYRIGQQKAVQVHRILIKDTVEDRIMELQEQKRKMVDAALDEEGGKSISRLGVEALTFLFGMGRGD